MMGEHSTLMNSVIMFLIADSVVNMEKNSEIFVVGIKSSIK